MTETQQLLRAYVENDSEAAFCNIVGRYVNFVYSTALRLVDNNSQSAEDVTQSVFSTLANKASSLPSDVQLGGWLHRHTCFVASNWMRSERRRLAREKEAAEMSSLQHEASWQKLAPILDDAINQLGEEDRQAIVLRFFEQFNFHAVGDALGVSDDTAQKRVTRALDKLRDLIVKRDATLSGVAIGTLLASEAVKAAPMGLAAKVSGTALASAKSAVTSIMWKAAAVIAAVVVLTGAFILSKNKTSAVSSTQTAQTNATTVSRDVVVTGNTAEEQGTNAGSLSPAAKTTNEIPVALAESAGSNVLSLSIVGADTGKPLSNVPLELWHQKRSGFSRKNIVSDRMGICRVPFATNTTQFQLTTQLDGYADTRLDWWPERGEVIPANYTLQLVRALPIGGRVVNGEGQPVAGARVGFNHDDDPASDKDLQTHKFSWIEVTTDSEGKWRINRIAPEMVRRIRGGAKHENYADSEYLWLSRTPGVEEKLRDQTHVFKLGARTLTVQGKVLDKDGEPVEAAKIMVGRSGNPRNNRTAVSTTDGSFKVTGCKPGKTFVTGEASGFAASSIEIDLAAGIKPVRLILEAGKTLRLRVLNEAGEPVPNARAWYDCIHRERGSGSPPPQLELTLKADNDGRMVWTNASDRELTFSVNAKGYTHGTQLTVRPDDKEHIITLARPVIVSGKVTDEKGRPIPRFRIICGYPQMHGDKMTPTWSPLERYWLSFEGGSYKHSLDEPVLYGTTNPGYVLKFEADGYTAFISRVIKPDEGEVRLDVALRSAQLIVVSVLLPNGRPATIADVGLVAPGARLQLSSGGFSRENVQSGGSLLTTDRQGTFKLPANEAVHKVMVAHPEGFATATPTELTQQPIIQLQPWGRIDGTYTSGGEPVAGREFTVNLEHAESSKLAFDFGSRVKTDARGRFIFPKLPPGKHQLVQLVHRQVNETTGSFSHELMQEVEIHSGQTTTVNVGGTGYTVKLRFRYPAGFKLVRESHLMVNLHSAITPPTEINSPEAGEAWAKTPEGQAFAKSYRNYNFSSEQDGSWIAENVPSGNYIAEIMAVNFASTGEAPRRQVHGKTIVIIPEMPATGVLDIGEVEVKEVAAN